MAVLTAAQLQSARNAMALDASVSGFPINYTKAQANAVLQAIEDWYEVNKGLVATAINTATAPVVLTALQKKKFAKQWFLVKFGIE